MSRSMDKSLDLLSHVGEGAQTLTELATTSGLPRSTAHRLAAVLVDHGFLRVAGHRYYLGYPLMELGELAKRHVRLPALARRHREATASATYETLHLGELVGTDIIYLEKIEGARAADALAYRPGVTCGDDGDGQGDQRVPARGPLG